MNPDKRPKEFPPYSEEEIRLRKELGFILEKHWGEKDFYGVLDDLVVFIKALKELTVDETRNLNDRVRGRWK